MSFEFEAALNYINLGCYDKAESLLKAAIKKETDKGDEYTAVQYRCVLGEMLADIGREKDSKTEFEAVLDYCDYYGGLDKQKEIAEKYLSAFDEKKPE